MARSKKAVDHETATVEETSPNPESANRSQRTMDLHTQRERDQIARNERRFALRQEGLSETEVNELEALERADGA